MGLFRNFECRAININGSRTSIALEPAFWQIADRQAQAEGKGWQQWAAEKLSQVDRGRASRLRVAILEAACN